MGVSLEPMNASSIAGRRWRPGPAEVGFALVLLATTAVEGVALAASWGSGYWVFDVAVALALTVLVVGRPAPPVPTAVAGLGIGALAVSATWLVDLPRQPGPAAALALAALTAIVVRYSTPATAGAVAAAWLVLIAAAQLAPSPDAQQSPVAVINGVCWVGALASGAALRARDERARAITARIRQEERVQLARELHDVVAHHVTGVVIQSQAAQVVARRDPDGVAAALTEIESTATDALTAMRRAVGLLRAGDDSAPLSPGPETLPELVQRFERQGPQVRLQAPDSYDRWSTETAATVHRIVQESLTNVLRHAPGARSVVVIVNDDGQHVRVEVVDEGEPSVGSSGLTRRPGYGLVGMAERVELLGGCFAAGPATDGSGWSVRATLPRRLRPALGASDHE
jgi:signal transduction histidine kinase